MTVPTGPGNTEKQLQMMRDMGTTVLCSTSSYALLLAEEIEKRGIRDGIRLRKGIIGSERWSPRMRSSIREKLGIELYDIYGLTEIYGPGIGISCGRDSGIHYWDDYIYVEVVDPATGRNVPDGEVGEIVITTLVKEGAPLIRYRTHDLSRIIPGTCPCGCRFPRLDTIGGRTDDMIKIKGVNVFPAQIEEILAGFPEVSSEYQIRISHLDGRDTMRLYVETDGTVDFQDLAGRIQAEVKGRIGFTPIVKVVENGLLPRSEKKTARVYDERYLRSEQAPVDQVGDYRGHGRHRVRGPHQRPPEHRGIGLPAEDEHGPYSVPLAHHYVRGQPIAHHDHVPRADAHLGGGHAEHLPRRFPYHGGLPAGKSLEHAYEGSDVHIEGGLRRAQVVRMGGHQLGTGRQVVICHVQFAVIHGGVEGQEHYVGTAPAVLYAELRELGCDLRGGQDANSGTLSVLPDEPGRGHCGGKNVGRGGIEPHAHQPVSEEPAGMGGVVGEEPERYTPLPEPVHELPGPRDGHLPLVEGAVHVQCESVRRRYLLIYIMVRRRTSPAFLL